MSRTILLTGATGFLGGHLARYWVESGDRVVALSRTGCNTQLLASVFDKIVWYSYDQGIDKPFSDHQFDAVVHAAGIYGRKGESEAGLVDINVRLGLELSRAAMRTGVRAFINAGTSLPPTLSSYALSKAQFVTWLRRLADETECVVVNVRIEHMYGPYDDESKFVTWLIRDMLKDEPYLTLTSGEQKRDFIYIDDVVSALDDILSVDLDKMFHEIDVGSGEAVPVRTMVETLKVLCACQTELRFGSAPLRENEPACLQADISTMCRLGWSCRTSLADGLAKTIEWEKQWRNI